MSRQGWWRPLFVVLSILLLFSGTPAVLAQEAATTATTETTEPVPSTEPTQAADPSLGQQPANGAPVQAPGAAVVEEIEDLRTQTSRTYLMSDGTYQAEISTGSVNYQNGEGRWQPIDNTLVTSDDPGYAYENAANQYALSLPNDLGTTPIKVSRDDAWVSFALRGATGAVTVEGDTATYPEIFPGVALVYEASNDLTKESLILRDASVAQAFTFDIGLSQNLTPKLLKDMAIDLTGKDGNVPLSLDAPFMIDANGTRSDKVALKLDKTATGYSLTLTPDARWLADPSRAWPVVIDPTVQMGPSVDTMISSSNPSTSYGSSTSIAVGYTGFNSSISRGLLEFNVQGAIGDKQVRVLNAEMGLYGFNAYQTTSTVEIHRATKAWSTSATWTNATGTTTWTNAGGDFDAAVADSEVVTPTQGWWTWYPTTLVQSWADGSVPNDGMLLKASSETITNQASFTSLNSTDTEHRPYLKVIYYPWIGEQRYWTFEGQGLTERLSANVNVANGNLMLQQTDLALQGTGLGLTVDRTYNSRVQVSAFRMGSWSMGTGEDVLLMPYAHNDRVFYGPSRYGVVFIRNANGSFQAPTGLDATLVDHGNDSYTLTWNKSGVKYRFTGSALTSIEDKNGNAVTFDAAGDIFDTQGRKVDITENTAGKVSSVSAPGLRSYGYGYDASNNLTSYTDPNGTVTSYAYSGYDLTKITDPNGKITTFSYDTKHRVTAITRVTDTVNLTGPTWTFTYNVGNTVVTDPNSDATTYTYDHLGRVTQSKDALNHTAQLGYTANSDVAWTKDANGNQTTYNYDTKNNLTSVQLPTGAKTTLAYADTAFPYFPTKKTDPQGSTWTYDYDAKGNLTSVINGLASQNTVTYAYDTATIGKLGTLTSMTDARGAMTSYSYDPDGNLIGVTPPSGVAIQGTSATVDTSSRVTSVTDGKGQRTSYGYDKLDRVTSITYRNAGGTTYGSTGYTYDDAGNQTKLTDTSGATSMVTSYGYDMLYRMTSKTLPDGRVISATYDGEGNLTSQQDAGGTVAYSYDAADNLTGVAMPGTEGMISFAYDDNNRRTTTTYPGAGGVAMSQVYDQSGRLTNIKGVSGTTTLSSFSYAYKQPGSTVDRGLRYTVTDKGSNVTAYSYDGVNRLTQAQTKSSAGTITKTYGYGYDGNSNRTSQTIDGTTTNWAYNAANEITTTGYSYDANGNLLTGNGFTFGYNPMNQTSSIARGTTSTAMTYSGPGQSDRTGAGSATFTSDLLGTAQIGSDYYVRDNRGAVLAKRQWNGTTSSYDRLFYLYDGLGNTVALVDGVGTVKNTYSYDPWGKVTTKSGTTPNPFQFGGAYGAYTESNGGTGLVKIGARYYDPGIGRWSQLDPLGGGYTYGGCNPVNSIDPTGLSPEDIAWACIGAVIEAISARFGGEATQGLWAYFLSRFGFITGSVAAAAGGDLFGLVLGVATTLAGILALVTSSPGVATFASGLAIIAVIYSSVQCLNEIRKEIGWDVFGWF